MRPIIDLSGRRFGRLLVGKQGQPRKSKSNYLYVVWLCDCDCGNKNVPVTASNLRKGDTKSCGCLRKEWIAKGDYRTNGFKRKGEPVPIWFKIFCSYTYASRRRNLDWDLTLEQFGKLIVQPCHYCGVTSSLVIKEFRHNGVDRKDCNLGYSSLNCVPCCKICNYAKRNLSYQEFLDHLQRIANFYH